MSRTIDKRVDAIGRAALLNHLSTTNAVQTSISCNIKFSVIPFRGACAGGTRSGLLKGV